MERTSCSHRFGGKWGIYQKPSNGAGNEERLLESPSALLPVSWSPDGRSIVYQGIGSKTLNDIWMLPLTGDRKPVPLLQTSFNEFLAQVSPDGKWLAYTSNESGRAEVYVQPFPSGAGKWQVSVNGEAVPRWRRDGRELFYVEAGGAGKMMTVDVMPASTFQAGTPAELFEHGFAGGPYGL